MITRGLGNPSAIPTRGLGGVDVRVVPPWWQVDRVGYTPSIVAYAGTTLHTARPVTATAAPVASQAAPVASLAAPVGQTPDPPATAAEGVPGDEGGVVYDDDPVGYTRLVSDGPGWSP